jgi:hypothetical protein
MKVFFTLFLFFSIAICFAQNDTIYFKNKDVIVGELKSLSSNIMIVKTEYSDSDFKIEFDKVIKLILENKYSIDLVSGQRLYGNVKSKKEKSVTIIDNYGNEKEVDINQIVKLLKIDDGFWNHFKGTFDFGYNVTRTNNSKQYNFSSSLSYFSDKWIHRGQYNQLFTAQDDTETIERTDWSLDTKRYLDNNWFFNSNVSFLSNTSQSLESRITPSIGAGNYLVRNNKLFFLCGGGLTYNIERYFDTTDNKNSTEALLLTQLNMFNFKNIDFYASITGYPSLSEKGRFRSDMNFKLKYDLPFDFYIKSELSINYDNQPANIGVRTDYVFSSGFGWELK